MSGIPSNTSMPFVPSSHGAELAEKIARFFGQGKEINAGGGRWQTYCPVHGETPDKSKPSLTIFTSNNFEFFWPKNYGISFKCWSPTCSLNAKGSAHSTIYPILIDNRLIDPMPEGEQQKKFVYAVGSKRMATIMPIPPEHLFEWAEIAERHVSDFLMAPAKTVNGVQIPAGRRHEYKLTAPLNAYLYTDMAGQQLGLVVRAELASKDGKRAKEIFQLVWGSILPKHADGPVAPVTEGWGLADMGVVPPYGTEYIRIATQVRPPPRREDQPLAVIIVEGEKKVDIANNALIGHWREQYDKDTAVVPWPIMLSGRSGGTGASTLTDWTVLTVLKPEVIYLWPDHDDAGYAAFLGDHKSGISLAEKLAVAAQGWGGTVKVVDIRRHPQPELFKNKWDVADYDEDMARSLGLSLAQFILERVLYSLPLSVYSRHAVRSVCPLALCLTDLISRKGYTGSDIDMATFATTPCVNHEETDRPDLMLHPCRTMCHLPALGINTPEEALSMTRFERDLVVVANGGGTYDIAAYGTNVALTSQVVEILFTNDIKNLHAQGVFGLVKAPPTISQALAHFKETRVVDRVTTVLGRGPVYVEGGKRVINTLASTPEAQLIIPGDIDMKLYRSMDRIICEMLTDSPESIKQLKQNLAANVRHCLTGRRHNRWLYLTGFQGTGKDLILSTIKHIPARGVAIDVDISTLQGDFMSPASYGLMHIQDAAGMPPKLYENLKKFANPVPVLVNVKGKPHMAVTPNVAFVFTSNQVNIRVDRGDRRLTLIQGPRFMENLSLLTQRVKEFRPDYQRIVDANTAITKYDGNVEAEIARRTYLKFWQDVDLDDYNWDVGPQDDPAKQGIDNFGDENPLDALLLNMIIEHRWPFATGLTCGTAIMNALAADRVASSHLRDVTTLSKIKQSLRRLGFREIYTHKTGDKVAQGRQGNTGPLQRMTGSTLNMLGSTVDDDPFFNTAITLLNELEHRLICTSFTKSQMWHITSAEIIRGVKSERWCPLTGLSDDGYPHLLPDAFLRAEQKSPTFL